MGVSNGVEKKNSFYKMVEEICALDRRYKADAYEFLMLALHFTQGKIKREGHLSGQELLEGIREFAIDQYGPMAKAVLNHWGIKNTLDFGNIVFNMVEKKLLSKTDKDSIDDFKDVYEFDTAFGNVFSDSVIDNIR